MIKQIIYFVKNSLIGLAIAIFFFGLLEVASFAGLRMYLGPVHADVFHLKMGRFSGPSLNENPEDAKKSPQNRFHFLGPDFSIKKPKHTFRVLTIGGSAVSGELSQSLRAELDKNCPEKFCEVIDGGVPGAVSAHELNNLTRWLSFSPDLIIVYEGWNNVYFSHYVPEAFASESAAVDRRTSKWHRIDMWLVRHSSMIQLLKALGGRSRYLLTIPVAQAAEEVIEVDWFGQKSSYKVDINSPVVDHFSQIYKRHLISMTAEARRKRVPIIFFLQPSLIHRPNQILSAAELKVFLSYPEATRQDWLKAASALFPLALKAQLDAQEEHKAPFFNFSGMGKGVDFQFFGDFVHLTPLGNQKVAMAIIQACKKEHLIKTDEFLK